MRLLLRTLLLGSLVACGAPVGGPTLTYYFTYDPRSLDPALSTDVPTGEVVALLYETLTRFDVEGALVPGLALRWEVDSAGTRYVFHLRPGVRFHDGHPLTARDVRASFERVLTPGSGGSRAWPLLPIAGAREYTAKEATAVRGIATPDDSTVVLTLTEPLNIFPKFLAMPATSIVPAGTPAGVNAPPVGSGPWRFIAWSHDDRLVLAKNADYWGGPPRSDTLIIRIVPEPLTQAAEYESGRLSVVEVPIGETRKWERDRPAELQRRVTIRDLYIAMNTRRGPLADVRVRRAINHAVPTEIILRNLMSGRGVRAAGVIPPGIAGYDSSRAPYAYDPAKARALLAEAGYATGLRLQLWRGQRAEHKRIAQAIQQELAKVGIAVEIVERDAASARAAARKGEADLFLSDWYADYPDAENFTYPLFASKNAGTGGNYAFLADTALDAMLERARRTTDSAEAVATYRAADQRIFDTAPWIFLWFPVDLWAERPEVTGWRIPAVFTGQRWMEARYRP